MRLMKNLESVRKGKPLAMSQVGGKSIMSLKSRTSNISKYQAARVTTDY